VPYNIHLYSLKDGYAYISCMEMTLRMIDGRMIIVFTCVAFLFFAPCCKTPKTAHENNGFTEIFNGKNLDGWDGDLVYWKVVDGNLTGEVTPSTLLRRNTFIIWRGGEVGDFELSVQYRITVDGNSGINYRSEELKDMTFVLKGYQGDLDGHDNYTGMNYEERGRTTIAKRGQKVILPPEDSLSGNITDNVWTAAEVIGSLGNEDSLKAIINKPGNWNDYHIVAKGNHLQHYINGVLMSDVTDNDPVHAKSKGLIGVQVHVGPPMKIEYRKFLLKRL
jgi:hypothetical protein